MKQLMANLELAYKQRLVRSICALRNMDFDDNLMKLEVCELREILDEINVMEYLKRVRPDIYMLANED